MSLILTLGFLLFPVFVISMGVLSMVAIFPFILKDALELSMSVITF